MLEFEIASTNTHCMIQFKGGMSNDTAAAIEQCRQSIIGKSLLGFRYVIIDMSQVEGVEGEAAIKNISQLQGTIRTLPAELRMSSLSPQVKATLTKASAVRAAELVANISEVPDTWGLSELVLAALLKRGRML